MNAKTRSTNVNEISEARLWKVLDSVVDKLNLIEDKLTEVVRLEERVNSHEQALARYGKRIDSHDTRLRETELWQANYGDKSSVERLITNVQDEVRAVKKQVNDLETNKDVNKGRDVVVTQVVKWLVGIAAAVIIFKLTRG